jgi:hypothetical protein
MREGVDAALNHWHDQGDTLSESVSALMYNWVKIAESRNSSAVPPPVAESIALDKMTRSLIGSIFESCGLPFEWVDEAHTQLSKLVDRHIIGDQAITRQGGVAFEALEYLKGIPVPCGELVLS